MLAVTSVPCYAHTLLARAFLVAGNQFGCSYGELTAAARSSLLQQQGALLQRVLSTNTTSPAAPAAAASVQQQQHPTLAPPAAPAAAKLHPLQPYIPPDLILPKVPGSSSAVHTAEFAAAAYSPAQLPPERWPEVAVVGRSNVGKSSLINCMLGSTSLAKVSKHPGKTQSINHYLVNRSWYLVDCPGYGYAKVSQAKRADWHSMTQQYFMHRATLVDILLLLDASLPPKDADLAGADWLLQRSLPLTLVFTKTDKAKSRLAGPADNIMAFRAALQAAGLAVPPHFATSAVKKQGAQQLLRYLAQRRAQAAQHQQQLHQAAALRTQAPKWMLYSTTCRGGSIGRTDDRNSRRVASGSCCGGSWCGSTRSFLECICVTSGVLASSGIIHEAADRRPWRLHCSNFAIDARGRRAASEVVILMSKGDAV